MLPICNLGLHGSHVGYPAIETLTFQSTEFNLRHVEPTAMLRRVMDFKTFDQPSRLIGRKCFIERSHSMGIQIIHHQPNFDCPGTALIKHLLDLFRPILPGAAFRYRHMSPAGQRFNFHEYFRHTISYIFIVNACRLARFARNWLAHFTNQLLAGFIHTDHRTIRIIGQMIHLQHNLHCRYKCRTPLRRDFPVLPEVRFVFAFLGLAVPSCGKLTAPDQVQPLCRPVIEPSNDDIPAGLRTGQSD